MTYTEYKKLNKELRKQSILRLMDELPLSEYIELENMNTNDFLKIYESTDNINKVLMEE